MNKLGRILVVDDDREMRSSLSHLLESAGFDCEVISDGNQVEGCLKKTEFDVIVSDVRMPIMGGLALLKWLNSAGNKTPLVLISAHGDVAMAVEAMQDGAYSFIEKPFEPRRLLSVLRNATNYRRLYRQAEQLRDQLSEFSAAGHRVPDIEPLKQSGEIWAAENQAKRTLNLDELPHTLREAVAYFEHRLISDAIITHAGRMDDVAEALGIGRRTLNEKIVKLGINKADLLNA